jgi:hypothetical protein
MSIIESINKQNKIRKNISISITNKNSTSLAILLPKIMEIITEAITKDRQFLFILELIIEILSNIKASFLSIAI